MQQDRSNGSPAKNSPESWRSRRSKSVEAASTREIRGSPREKLMADASNAGPSIPEVVKRPNESDLAGKPTSRTSSPTPGKTFLSKCSHCMAEKQYGQYYNAAAHLRRVHFYPPRRGRRNKLTPEKKTGVQVPSTEEMKKNWLKQIEIRADSEDGVKSKAVDDRMRKDSDTTIWEEAVRDVVKSKAIDDCIEKDAGRTTGYGAMRDAPKYRTRKRTGATTWEEAMRDVEVDNEVDVNELFGS